MPKAKSKRPAQRSTIDRPHTTPARFRDEEPNTSDQTIGSALATFNETMLAQQRQFLDSLAEKLQPRPASSAASSSPSMAKGADGDPEQVRMPTRANDPAEETQAAPQDQSGMNIRTELHYSQVHALGLPVGALLPLKVKKRVWQHEYIDLYDLL